MNKKKKIILSITILLVLAISFVIYYGTVYDPNFRYLKMSKEEKDIVKAVSNQENFSLLKITYETEDTSSVKAGYLYIEKIMIFDESGLIVDTRVKETGYSDNKLQEAYNLSKDLFVRTNVEIRDNILYYNTSAHNGRNIDEITSSHKSLKNVTITKL